MKPLAQSTSSLVDAVFGHYGRRHYSYDFPDELTCEVKLHDAPDFCVLGVLRIGTFLMYCADDPSLEMPPDPNLFPESYRSKFLAMARMWSRILDITEVTPSKVIWPEGKDRGLPVFVDESDDATDDDHATTEDSFDTPSTSTHWKRRSQGKSAKGE